MTLQVDPHEKTFGVRRVSSFDSRLTHSVATSWVRQASVSARGLCGLAGQCTCPTMRDKDYSRRHLAASADTPLLVFSCDLLLAHTLHVQKACHHITCRRYSLYFTVCTYNAFHPDSHLNCHTNLTGQMNSTACENISSGSLVLRLGVGGRE